MPASGRRARSTVTPTMLTKILHQMHAFFGVHRPRQLQMEVMPPTRQSKMRVSHPPCLALTSASKYVFEVRAKVENKAAPSWKLSDQVGVMLPVIGVLYCLLRTSDDDVLAGY